MQAAFLVESAVRATYGVIMATFGAADYGSEGWGLEALQAIQALQALLLKLRR